MAAAANGTEQLALDTDGMARDFASIDFQRGQPSARSSRTSLELLDELLAVCQQLSDVLFELPCLPRKQTVLKGVLVADRCS